MRFICPDCGTQYESGKFCQECGAKLQEITPELVCPSCGYKAKSGKFCPECGTKLTEQIISTQTTVIVEASKRTFNEKDPRFAKYYDKKGFPRAIPQEEQEIAKEELTPYVRQGIAEAKMLLAFILLNECKKSKEKDECLKCESLIKEAEEAGDKFAYYMMGMIYLIKGETEKLAEAEKRLLECYAEYQDGEIAGILSELYVYTENYKKALEYATIAADNDDDSGFQVLGALCLNGWGVEKDLEKAIENYTQAAALGDELSMNQIGYIYLGEEGGEANPKQAFYWFNEAAKKGSDVGMYNLGCCYREGYGVEADTEIAAEWFKKSADLGYANAMKDLGQYYQEVLIDKKKAKMWYAKAVEVGDIDSLNLLAVLYADEGNYEEAIKLYKKAIAHNDPWAYRNYALCLWNGDGCDEDRSQAIEMMQKSVKLGNTDAENELTEMQQILSEASKQAEVVPTSNELHIPEGTISLSSMDEIREGALTTCYHTESQKVIAIAVYKIAEVIQERLPKADVSYLVNPSELDSSVDEDALPIHFLFKKNGVPRVAVVAVTENGYRAFSVRKTQDWCASNGIEYVRVYANGCYADWITGWSKMYNAPVTPQAVEFCKNWLVEKIRKHL